MIFLEAIAGVLASTLARRTAEAAAEQTHRMLEAVIEGTIDDIFVKDLDGRLIAVNASAALTLGRPREELIERTLFEVMPPLVAEMFAETDRQILERGTVETFEETVTRGDVVSVLLTTKGPYRVADGTLLGTFGIAHDISARKAQKRSSPAAKSDSGLPRKAPTWERGSVDLVTRTTTWSDDLRALYCVGPDAPAGFAHFRRSFTRTTEELVARRVSDAYEKGIDFEVECRIVRPGGALRWLLTRSTSLRDENGVLVRVLGVAIDITERKLAEEEHVRSAETLRLAQEAAFSEHGNGISPPASCGGRRACSRSWVSTR